MLSEKHLFYIFFVLYHPSKLSERTVVSSCFPSYGLEFTFHFRRFHFHHLGFCLTASIDLTVRKLSLLTFHKSIFQLISNHGVTRDHVAGLLLGYKFMVTKYVTERATTLITQRTGECLEDVDEL